MIRLGSLGEKASVVVPPDGQHPSLLWFVPHAERGGRQQLYLTERAAGSSWLRLREGRLARGAAFGPNAPVGATEGGMG